MRRSLSIKVGGVRREGELEISQPIEDAVKRVWYSTVRVSPIMQGAIRVSGDDEIDALLRAVSAARNIIGEHKLIGWEVVWEEVGDDGGL